MRNDFMNCRLSIPNAALVLVVAFVFAPCCNVTVAAQQKASPAKPKITIDADRSAVQIADPFNIVIQVVTNDGTSVRFPTVPIQLGAFEVIDHHDLLSVPSETNNGTNQSTRRLTLETLETGKLQIPPIEVVVRTEGKPSLRVATEPLAIEVATVLKPTSDPAKFADIHDVIDVPEPETWSYSWMLWWVGGGIGLSALIAGVLLIFRRRPNWTTPANWAIGEISGLTSNSSHPLTSLEHVVRTYIEEEFHVPATSYSPVELQHAVLQLGASQNTSQQLVDFLTKAEQTKYAGMDVSDSQFISSKESTLQVIKALDSISEDNDLRNGLATTKAEVA